MPMRALRNAGILAALMWTGAAAAQSPGTYPNRPVTLIVPYGAGGVADVGMRILAGKMSDRLHAQFVVRTAPAPAALSRRKPAPAPRPTAIRWK